MKVYKTQDGEKFNCTNEQYEILETLKKCRKGAFATIHGYKPKTGVIEQPVYDINFISKFSYRKLLEREMSFLNSVELGDIVDYLAQDEKLANMSLESLKSTFETRLNMILTSKQKSLDGVTDNAHRQAHVRNYVQVSTGVKVNLVTEKNHEGKQIPVRDNLGYPTAKTIMVSALEISRKTIEKGTYKTVNSGVPVRIGKAITKWLNAQSKSFKYKQFSLNENNFDSLRIDRNQLLNESLQNELSLVQ